MTAFIDLPSLLFVGSVLVAGAISESFNLKRSLSAARDLAVPMGLIGSLIGIVMMLANLEDPSLAGPALSVALLTTIYGLVLYPLLNCFASLFPSETAAEAAGLSKGVAGLAVLLIILAAALIMGGEAGDFMIFINLPSVLCLLILTIIPGLIGKYHEEGEDPMPARLLALRDYSIATVLVGTLISGFGLLQNPGSPQTIGPSVAVGLLSLLYGLLASLTATHLYRSVTGESAPRSGSHQLFYLSIGLFHFVFWAVTLLSMQM